MERRTLKTAGIIFAVFLVIYLISVYLMGSYMGFFADKADLKNNFDKKDRAIAALADYMQKITPEGSLVRFASGNKGKITAITPSGRWEAKADSAEAEPLLRELGWSTESIATLKDMLKIADCVSVTSANPDRDSAVFVEYRRNGMGYLVFPADLTESQQKEYTGYGNTFYKNNIVFIHDDWWMES